MKTGAETAFAIGERIHDCRSNNERIHQPSSFSRSLYLVSVCYASRRGATFSSGEFLRDSLSQPTCRLANGPPNQTTGRLREGADAWIVRAVKKTATTSAHLTEVFSSIQGEGPYVGVRQIFVRFYGCHRRCEFCDSPETVTAWQPAGFKPASFRVETPAGSGRFDSIANPVSIDALIELIASFEAVKGLNHSVALTGGEPLLHAGFLSELMPRIRELGLKTYLETAGDLFHELDRVIAATDIVAMDLKLPSVTKNEPAWGHHKKFLQRCRDAGVEVFAKAIVGVDTSDDDLLNTAKLIAEIAPETLLVFQPLTPFGSVKTGPTPAQLLRWHTLAREVLPDVRVIPQCHKMMGHL